MISPTRRVRWYTSFYWRIAISFVVFVVVVLVAQSLMVGYARSNGAFAPGNPNGTAAAIAADLGAALKDDPDLDLSRFLAHRFSDVGRSAYVVMADGRLASISRQPLRADIERQARVGSPASWSCHRHRLAVCSRMWANCCHSRERWRSWRSRPSRRS
jgi:hypothetical protein